MKLSFRPRLAALVLLAALLEAAFLALRRLLAPPPDVVGVIGVALAASVVYFAAARLAWRWVEPGRAGASRASERRARPPPSCTAGARWSWSNSPRAGTTTRWRSRRCSSPTFSLYGSAPGCQSRPRRPRGGARG